MSLLLPSFTFSQSSLQAYTDCPRRFWLAYVEQLPWPAVEASPIHEHEEQMRLGERFHRLVQRTEVGIAPNQRGCGADASSFHLVRRLPAPSSRRPARRISGSGAGPGNSLWPRSPTIAARSPLAPRPSPLPTHLPPRGEI